MLVQDFLLVTKTALALPITHHQFSFKPRRNLLSLATYMDILGENSVLHLWYVKQ